MLRRRLVVIFFAATALPAVLFAQSAPDVAVAATRFAASRPADAGHSFIDELKIDELLRHNLLRNWMVLLLAIVVAIAVGRISTFLLVRVARRLEARGWHSQAQVFAGLASPANLAIFTIGLCAGLVQIVMSPLLQDVTKRTLLLLYAIAVFWYAFNLVTVLEVALRKITSRTDTALDDDLVPVIRKALRVFIVVIGALFIVQNVFDRDIGAWLAGLGIAGLAFSLAAQDSLKNLFGSLTILFDRPFTLGQRIKFHGFDGTVEEIGFRSTKVRSPEGSVVTIPNSNIVNDPVDNWAQRQRIRRLFNVTITYDTPVAKVRRAVEIIRELLASQEFRGPLHDPDPVANVDPPRVYFNEFNPESLNIQVLYWYRPANWWEYMDHTQRFNIRLMEEYEKEGIEFAFPTRTLFLAGDPRRQLSVGLLSSQEPGEPHP
jgi:MscS family membrane protein